MKTTMMFLSVALLTGCASQQRMDQLSTQMTELNKRTETLIRENAMLRARLLGQPHQPVASAPQPVRRAMRPAQLPPHPVMPLLPMQEHGYLYTPARNCSSGPFRLVIFNKTSGYFVRILVNGKPVSNYGGYGPLPHLPPGQELNVCLDHLGSNNISGIVYSRYKGTLRKVKTFSVQQNHRLSADGVYFIIDDRLVEW